MEINLKRAIILADQLDDLADINILADSYCNLLYDAADIIIDLVKEIDEMNVEKNYVE